MFSQGLIQVLKSEVSQQFLLYLGYRKLKRMPFSPSLTRKKSQIHSKFITFDPIRELRSQGNLNSKKDKSIKYELSQLLEKETSVITSRSE